MAKYLIVFDSTSGNYKAGCMALLNYAPSSTVLDCKGTTPAGLAAKILALTDNTYDKCIFMTKAISEAGTSGSTTAFMAPNALCRAYAFDKLKSTARGTLLVSGTAQALVDTTHTDLAAGTGIAGFDNMVYTVTAGTNSAVAADKTRVIESIVVDRIAYTTAKAAGDDATSVYSIYNTSTSIINYAASSGGKTPAQLAWELVYTTNVPVAIKMMRDFLGNPIENTNWTISNSIPGYGHAYHAGTASAGAAGTITLENTTAITGGKASTAQLAVNDFLKGKYVYIVAGPGECQYRKITGYTGATGLCTLESSIDPYLPGSSATVTTALSGASYYVVVDSINELFADVAINCFFKYCMPHSVTTDYVASFNSEVTFADMVYNQRFGANNEILNRTTWNVFQSLIDKNGKLSTVTSGAVEQDFSYLFTQAIARGYAAFRATALNGNVVLSV